jgi:hypothetical protein
MRADQRLPLYRGVRRSGVFRFSAVFLFRGADLRPFLELGIVSCGDGCPSLGAAFISRSNFSHASGSNADFKGSGPLGERFAMANPTRNIRPV